MSLSKGTMAGRQIGEPGEREGRLQQVCDTEYGAGLLQLTALGAGELTVTFRKGNESQGSQ